MHFTTPVNTFSDILESIKTNGRCRAPYRIDGFWTSDPVCMVIHFRYGGKIEYDISCSSGGNKGDNIAAEMLNKASALAHAASLINECYGREEELYEALYAWKAEMLEEYVHLPNSYENN